MNAIQNPVIDERVVELLKMHFKNLMDPQKIQEMYIEHQIRNQLLLKSLSSVASSHYLPIYNYNDSKQETEPPETSSQIAKPVIVFEYDADCSQNILTPRSTPERERRDDETIIYKKAEKNIVNFHAAEDVPRFKYIHLKEQDKRLPPSSPSSLECSESEVSEHQDNVETFSKLPELMHSEKVKNWKGVSIYHNLPEICMGEYDKILQESHNMKMEVVDRINTSFPVNYDYNPRKSRIRTNYSDPNIAEDRTKNNIASRRSRQRKKFMNHVLEQSLEYDMDENFLQQKQVQWLRGIIDKLEQLILAKVPTDEEKLSLLRKQSGFE